MKQILLIALCAIMMSANVATAQTRGNQEKGQRMSREQLAEAQAKHIAYELALDDATTQKFIKTYMDYQKEVWALGPRVGKGMRQDVTEDEAQQNIKNRFDHSQKILELREKYYAIYSTFLTQKQIERMYELERQSMRRLSKGARGSHHGAARPIKGGKNHQRRA